MANVSAPEMNTNGGGTSATLNTSEQVRSKHQRRPSVRLGDNGDQPSDSHSRRITKPWRFSYPNSSSSSSSSDKPSKTRPLTNLTSGETLEVNEREAMIGSWKVSDSKKSVAKKGRSNWLCHDLDAEEKSGWRWDDVRGECGVRIWLNGLGLGRYAPVFKIHEVDDEVLPLLTLEDLKDMGINAVGSRRKIYCAIQNLTKG